MPGQTHATQCAELAQRLLAQLLRVAAGRARDADAAARAARDLRDAVDAAAVRGDDALRELARALDDAHDDGGVRVRVLEAAAAADARDVLRVLLERLPAGALKMGLALQ